MPRKHQEPGKRVSAAIVNYGVEARDLLDTLAVGAPLQSATGRNGIAISYTGPLVGLEAGITSGTITAASGTTPGTGTVDIYQMPFSGAAVAMTSVTVQNWSVNSAPSGAHCYIARIHGVYQILFWDGC